MIDAGFFITIFGRGTADLNVIPVSLFKICGYDEALSAGKGDSLPLAVTRGKKGINVKLYCTGCQKYHDYHFALKTLIKKGGHYIYCPESGLELGFLGAKEDVQKVVDRHRLEVEALIKEMGLDDYFKNPMVIYDLINYIHDMAEKKKIYCQCGSFDINASLSFDRIDLYCKKCGGTSFLNARNSDDLEAVKRMESIVIKTKEACPKLFKY